MALICPLVLIQTRPLDPAGGWLSRAAWTATAKSTDASSNGPAGLLDDNAATLWYSDQTVPQWVRVELPGVACVSAIRFGGGTAPVKRWSLATSTGTTVATGTNADTTPGTWSHEVTFAWTCDRAFEFRMPDAHATAGQRLGLATLQLFGQMQGIPEQPLASGRETGAQ